MVVEPEVWRQINTVFESGANTGYGLAVSLSAEGSVLATGFEFNESGQDSDNNLVANNGVIYLWDRNTNTNPFLFKKSTEIQGDTGGEQAGEQVSLSADGKVLAFSSPGLMAPDNFKGQVRVYQNGGHQDIIKGDENERVGGGVSLSGDGKVLAISKGGVRVYQNKNNVWTQIGQVIIDAGGVFQLSKDGKNIAVGARVYKNINNVWTQIGQVSDKEGYSVVSISDDGSVVAHALSGSKVTRVYQNDGTNWKQIGQDIKDNEGKSVTDRRGRSIYLSGDGSVVAISYQNTDGDFDPGYVRVYRNVDGTWKQIGTSIKNGNTPISNISLSKDGKILAIGGVKAQYPYFTVHILTTPAKA